MTVSTKTTLQVESFFGVTVALVKLLRKAYRLWWHCALRRLAETVARPTRSWSLFHKMGLGPSQRRNSPQTVCMRARQPSFLKMKLTFHLRDSLTKKVFSWRHKQNQNYFFYVRWWFSRFLSSLSLLYLILNSLITSKK